MLLCKLRIIIVHYRQPVALLDMPHKDCQCLKLDLHIDLSFTALLILNIHQRVVGMDMSSTCTTHQSYIYMYLMTGIVKY